MRKKRILIHSNHSKSYSGFGRHVKEILTHLHKTGKYEIVEYCSGRRWDEPELQFMPWKAFGTLPTDEEFRASIDGLRGKEKVSAIEAIQYGSMNIDRVVMETKPDVYFALEDIWGLEYLFNKEWLNKTTSVIHSPIDSLPLLPEHIEAGKAFKNYWVWATFAKEALHKKGIMHAEVVHGALNSSKFFRHSNADRLELRHRNNIPTDAFVVGFVFRNQIRKSVWQLLEGFKIFCDENPDAKPYLLLHTNWADDKDGSWHIPRLIKETGVDPSRVLTTYFCRNCKGYDVKPYQLPKEEWDKDLPDLIKGQAVPCRFCGSPNGQVTAGASEGVSEEQLNEVYNLMDVYCHCATSGGQELPLQEAKMTELITLATNYSCMTDWNTEESGGFPLDCTFDKQILTHFTKAVTSPFSISKQLKRVFNMKPSKRVEMGKKARQYTIDKVDSNVISKIYEDFIDAAPFCEWMIEKEEVKKTSAIETHFDQNGNKRVLFVIKESIGDCFICTSLFKSIKESYPSHDLYVACEHRFEAVFAGNPYVHKCIPYHESMQNEMEMIGYGENKGIVDVYFNPAIGSQRQLNYLSNNNLALELQ